MRTRLTQMVIVSVCLVCVGAIVGPAHADFKNFGIYQDTNSSGVLDVGDTYIDGFMSWYTYYSAASSYNYSAHDDNALIGSSELTGAPYASDHDGDTDLAWLPMDDDELHMYVAWSEWDNTSSEGIDNQRTGFALGMIANDYVRDQTGYSSSGGYELDIAIRNDGTALPHVTLSDDYTTGLGLTTGRPPFPGTKDNFTQELYKITDPDGPDPYNHHFEGRWDYTASHSTADGGVISGIHNGDYDIEIDPSSIVTAKLGDGLVIRIDPQNFTEDGVSKIVMYDFGYYNGAVDTLGSTMPAGYVGSDVGFAPLGIEIPINDLGPTETFFIASIPEVIPEPATLLNLAIMALAGALVTRRRHNRA